MKGYYIYDKYKHFNKEKGNRRTSVVRKDKLLAPLRLLGSGFLIK